MVLRYFPLLVFVLSLAISKRAVAGDPDILSDFIAPLNNTQVNGTYFTFAGFRGLFDTFPKTFKVTKAALTEFPALNGQSVSYAVLQFPGNGGVNPPHTHPRSAELLFLVEGSLDVGFVDTKNLLYTQKLETGDMFVFPKGLVHYQFNSLPDQATAISAFGSANAGTVSVPASVFATGIDSEILAKAFKTDIDTIDKIKAGLTG